MSLTEAIFDTFLMIMGNNTQLRLLWGWYYARKKLEPATLQRKFAVPSFGKLKSQDKSFENSKFENSELDNLKF